MNTDRLAVECECGASDALDSAEDFTDSEWAFFGERDVVGGDDHHGYCPGCDSVREVRFERDPSDESDVLRGTLGTVVLPPEFAAEGDVDRIGARLSTVASDGTPVLGVCPSCDAPVLAAHRHEGPDAPELGWTYYRCPNCEARLSPSSVNSDA